VRAAAASHRVAGVHHRIGRHFAHLVQLNDNHNTGTKQGTSASHRKLARIHFGKALDRYAQAEHVVRKQDLNRNLLQVVLEMTALQATDGKKTTSLSALKCICAAEIDLTACFDEALTDEERSHVQILLTRLERQLSKCILELIKTVSTRLPASWAGTDWIAKLKACYATVLQCASSTDPTSRAVRMAELVADMRDSQWLRAPS